MGIIPTDQLAASTSPFADAAGVAFGGGWDKVIAAIALVSTFGALNGWILLQGRVPMAAAEDGMFPAPFAKVHGKRRTPVFGLVVSSVLVTALMLMNYTKGLVGAFEFVILLATLTTLVPYAYSAAAQAWLWLVERETFQPLHLVRDVVIATLAFAYSVWAIAGAGDDIVTKGFILLLAGIPVYVGMRWWQRRKLEHLTLPEPEPGEGDRRCALRLATRLFVGSEVGTLRRVLLHRPDLELKRLTPRNKDALLFDDVLWVKRARQEHDAFADALAERGVEVLYLEELLAQTLALPAVRDEVLARHADGRRPRARPRARRLRGWLAAVPAVELADRLIGGITYDELPFASAALSAQVPALDGFVLAPLPNHLFTRDTSAWIYDGVSVNAMAKPARRRESIHYDAIYRHHPLFADATTRSGATASAARPSSRAATSSSSATAAC